MRRIPLFLLLLAVAGPLAPAPAARDVRATIAEAERLHDQGQPGFQKLIDEALAALENSPDQKLRFTTAAEKCFWTAESDAPAALALAEKFIPDAERAGAASAAGELHLCRGSGLESRGDLAGAMTEYEYGVALAARLGDRTLTADARLLRGELRYYRGQMNDALEDLQEAYRLNVALARPSETRTALGSIANLYADARVGEFDRAIEYYRQQLAALDASGSPEEVSTAHYNIGATLETKGDLEAALPEYKKSLEIEKGRKDLAQMAAVERSIGVVLGKLSRLPEALGRLDSALEHFKAAGDSEGVAQARLSRGIVLRKLGRLREAIAELDFAKSHFSSPHNARYLEKIEEERSLALAAAGRWEDAYRARVDQIALQRELDAKLKEEHTSRMRVQFDTEKKEAENRALLRENELRDRALRAGARVRRLQAVVIILAVVILGFLAYVVARKVADAKRLRILAMTDELTRLPNRRHVLTLAEDALAAVRSGGAPASLLALDIDHFKSINDTLGHDAGDEVLRRVSRAARLALRPGDTIGRTGGEEFLVVLPKADARQAAEVAERLRAAVEALDWSDLDSGRRVTVSVGVTEAGRGDSFAAAARRADDSLYRAKETGRNRVVVAAT